MVSGLGIISLGEKKKEGITKRKDFREIKRSARKVKEGREH